MTSYHPDPQRAYESHCADGYVVPDDEVLVRIESFTKDAPQEATGATESDVPRIQAHGDGAWLREAVEALADEWERSITPDRSDPWVRGWDRAIGTLTKRLRAVLAAHPAPAGDVIERTVDVIAGWLVSSDPADQATASCAQALADAGLLVSDDVRGALDETLDDLTRTLARAEKAEAEVARLTRALRDVRGRLRSDCADPNCIVPACQIARALDAALSDTTPEAS